MSAQKLLNPPLQEVVFEARWELRDDNDESAIIDRRFKYALGILTQRLASEFPVVTEVGLFTDADFQVSAPYYQYRADELAYPLVQFGPGLLTINEDGKNYQWESAYRDTVLRVLQTLRESYEPETLVFDTLTLQYTDAFDLPLDEQDELAFIQKNLNTVFQMPPAMPGTRNNFYLDQINELPDGSLIRLIIRSALNTVTGAKAVVWDIGVRCEGVTAFDDVAPWLDMAYSQASPLFKKMLNPDFYASFDA